MVGMAVEMPRGPCHHPWSMPQPQLMEHLLCRAVLAPPGALAQGDHLVIQVPLVHLDPWDHQDLQESL